MKTNVLCSILLLCTIFFSACREDADGFHDCTNFLPFTPQETTFTKGGGTVTLKTTGTFKWYLAGSIIENGIEMNLNSMEDDTYTFDLNKIIANNWFSIKKIDEKTIEVTVQPLVDDCMSMRSIHFQTSNGPCWHPVVIIQKNIANK